MIATNQHPKDILKVHNLMTQQERKSFRTEGYSNNQNTFVCIKSHFYNILFYIIRKISLVGLQLPSPPILLHMTMSQSA